MADNPIKVKAYGKVLNFPAGTAPEAIEQALAEHEPSLNPEYKPPEPEALDYAKGFASGANKLVSGVGFLAEAAGAKETGKAIREFGDRGAKYWNDKMSAGGKLASKSQVFVDDDNEESITGIKLSDDWGKALLMSASQSLPSMFAAAIPGVAVTKGIQALAKLGLAGGAGATIPLLAGTAAPVGVASNIIARAPSAIGFGASEGVVAGAMNASEFKASIEGMTDEELSKSPVYRALKTEHDPETARSMLAEQAALDLFGKTAVSTGAIGALTGGGALSQAYQKVTSGAKTGLLGTVIKGAGSEALQEGPQSGGEQYIQNLTTKNFLDPTKDTTEGVATAAASGAAVGGFMGGVVGGGSAVNITPDRRAQVLNEKRKLAEMKASTVNAHQQEQDMANIGAAQDIDQTIAAATKATSRPVVHADDVLRTEDPTLADIEKLTGLKPTEAIDTAIGEINDPQPQEELKNVDTQTQQKAPTKTTVLDETQTGDIGGTGTPTTERVVESPVPKVKDTSTPVKASVTDSKVLDAETFKASNEKGADYTKYLRDHPNREQAAKVDAQVVESNLVKGLQKTGKFTATDSKTYAKPFSEFYRVNAERQGILPSELYERMPLKFSGKKAQTLSQDARVTPASRNVQNFDLKDATPEDFTPENVGSLVNRKNWAVLTAANPDGKAQDDSKNLEANKALQKELADRGLAFEVVKGRYPGDKTEMESYLVYGIDQKAANELGNKYGQDSVLTREGLVYKNGKVTPVKAVGKGKPDGYTKVIRTGARFAFDMDWDRERGVNQGALSLVGRHYSKEHRKALEGSRFGQGLPGKESDRVRESDDPRLKSRVDFYVDTGEGVTPEAGLGNAIHEKLLHNIYDASTNPKRFKFPSDWLGGNVFEKQVLDAGYDGYFTKQGKQGRVVVLGDAAKSIPIEDTNENEQGRESELLSQSSGENKVSRESDGSLQGLPRNIGQFNASLHKKAEKVAKDYMKSAGLEYNPPNAYASVNVPRAERIAQAFDSMKHDPQNPEVKAAYDALVKETTAQYKVVIDSGLKVEFIDFDKTGDPYAGNPRAMTEDVRKNNHMWVFSTRDGFGSSDFDPADNPLLAETEFEISGQKALVNDLFRVVHDYFGHVKEGVGFRAAGEENAWRAHMAMFSPLAGRALTTETRGQNSWVNYGPFAEFNRTASGADTKYADQKIGLLPEWASTEGRADETEEYNQSVKLSNAKETLKKYGLKPDGKYSTRQVAAALEARQRAKFGSIEAGDYSKESLDKIASWMAEEVNFEMQNPQDSGVGWYSEKFQRALDALAVKHPELADDKNARNTMTALIAITSDGQKVGDNLRMAEEIYNRYSKTGKLATTNASALRNSFEGNVKALQGLYDRMGVEDTHKFLLEEKTLSELKKLAAEHGETLTSPYQADFKLPMAALAFGPKLGAFYANLMGSHGYLTMDRWWSRTFNRYRGTLLQLPTGSGLSTFRELIGQDNLSDDETIAASVAPRKAYEARGFKSRLAELVGSSEPATDKAKVNWMETAKAKAGAKFPELLKEHNIERAANTIYKKAFENLEDAPFGAKDRTFMVQATEAAQKKLKRKGVNVSIADIQAILWYYEKKLYGKMGAKQSGVISYEEAARRLVSGKATGPDLAGRAGTEATEVGGGEVSVGEDDFAESYKQSNFYSALEKEIGNLKKIANKDGLVSVEQAKAWINSRQKEGKFKQAEVEAVGLIDWLDTLEGKVPVADVENFVQENGVQVEEVVLEGSSEPDIDEDRVFDIAREKFNESYESNGDEIDAALAEVADEMFDDHGDSRWESLVGLSDAEEVEAFLKDEEISTQRNLVHLFQSRYAPEDVLGEDEYSRILDDAAEQAWEQDQDYYLDQAREELTNEAGGGSGGTEFGQYVLREGDVGYKELLLTLPKSKAKFNAPHFDRAQDDGAENIFAHTRINERYVDAPMTDEEIAAKKAYAEWQAGNNSPEIKQLLKDKEEAGRDYRVALDKWKEKAVRDTSISDKQYEEAISTLSSNPPDELKPFIKRIEEIGAKVKAKQEERLAVKPPEPARSDAKERVLFVEEIQSDWAQKGRDEGFATGLTKEEQKEFDDLNTELYALNSKELTPADQSRKQDVFSRIKELKAKRSQGIPTAPFVTDTKAWTGLVAKRLLRYAAENGFDRIAWTAGAQQAERYRLSKFVDRVTANRSDDGKYYVKAVTEDGKTVAADFYEADKLAGTFGKELADKIISQPEGEQVYSGLDLDVGGSGMKEFYDRIVPSVFNDISRKLGGDKVETISMGGQSGKVVTGLEGRIVIAYPNGSYLKNRNTGVMTESQDRADRFDSREEATKFLDKFESQNLHDVGRQMSLAITPALKEKVMQGLPLFQRDRAGYNPNTFTISLMDGSDMSSVIHEGGHFYLEALADMASQPNAPKQIVDDFDTTLQWFGLGDQVQDSAEPATRAQGYPTEAGEPIATFRKADEIKSHPSYTEAKAGSDQAAFDLVNDLVTENELNKAKERFVNATFVPVSLLDKDGANRIPTALAYHYANATGGSVSDSIFESKKAYHTGMNAMERLVSRANFSGKVEPGRRYVLVDDVTTVGSTLADLASYIQENGGEVIGSVLLANATRSGNMFANAKTLKRLEVQYGNEIRELFKIEPNALTQEEAQYLIGFRNADELRGSAIKAQGSRLARIHARKISKGQSSVDQQRLRDIWQSMTLEQKRPYHEQWAQSFELYAMEGVSPTEEMQPVFERFKQWMLETYKSLKEFLKNNPLAGRLNNEVRQVFDRLLASDADIAATAAARSNLKQSGKPTQPKTEAGASSQKAESKVWKGKAFRAYDSNVPKNSTLKDVLDFEADELGNTDLREEALVNLKSLGIDPSKTNRDKFLWVTKTAEDAERYLSEESDPDDIQEVDVVGWHPIIDMGEEGYLVVAPASAATAGAGGTLKQSGIQTPPAAAPKKPFNPNEDIPETKFRRAQRLSQDSFNRFTVIKEWLEERGIKLSEKADVFQAEERYNSLVANQLEDFREQQRNPLIEKIAKAGFTMADVADFLEAQHAEEANIANRKLTGLSDSEAFGISDADAKAYLAKADPKLAKLANELRDITEQSKQMRLAAGLLSQDEVDAMDAAYKFYIPVKGDADAKGGTGKGLKVNFKSKRRLGHGKRSEAVIENIFLDHERAIMQVEKNRVAKHLVMMAAEMNMPEIVSIGQPVKRNTLRTKTAYEVQVNGVTRSIFNNKQAADMFKQLLPTIDKSVQAGTISINPTSDSQVIAMASPMLAENEINVYIDGHAIRVQINDDLLARAYGKLGVTGFSALVSAGRAFNGYLSKVYTGYNPEFILTNMIRDFTSGLINLSGEEGGKIALKASANYVKSFGSLMKYAISNGKKSDKWIDMYRANGGNTGAAYLSDLERLGDEVKTEYASYQGVLKNLKSGDIANASRAAGRKAFNVTLKWIYNLNQAGENAMRLSAFRAMIESGKTPNEAAKAAKNITVNFNRKGELGAEANAAYLFFNASVQGTAALAHAHFKGKHKAQAWGLSSMVGVLGYLATMALIGDDEDDYDKINDYTKSRNFMIKAGDGYAQVPVPYGYGFFWNTGRAIAEAQHKGELGKLPWHMAASAIEELTPFSDTVVGSQDGFQFDQVLLGMLPTVIKIPAQPAFNRQLFSGGEMFPERASQQFQPDREKLWRSTQGTMYDKLAGWLSDAGLGDVSPETLKHYTRTATGGTGALVDATVSATMLKKEGAELEPSEIPFARKAYSKITIKEHRAAYYKAREEAQKTAEAFSRAKVRNDVTTIDKLVKDEGEMIGLDAYANSLSEAIGAVRDLQDAIRLDESLNAAEKRVQIKELEITEGKFYDQYLDVFKTEKLKMKERKD